MTLEEYLEKFPDFATINSGIISRADFWDVDGRPRPYMLFVCPLCGYVRDEHRMCSGTLWSVRHTETATIPIPELVNFLITRSRMTL